MSVVKINAIEVPDGAGPELETRFAARKGAVDGYPGFEGFQLLRPVAGESRYFVVTTWASDADYQNWFENGMRASHSASSASADGDAPRQRPVGAGATLLEFEVVEL